MSQPTQMKRSNSSNAFGLFGTSPTSLPSASIAEERKSVLDVMGITVDSNVVELEKLKGIIKQAKEKSAKDFGVNKKARSLNKVGMWEELEQLYKDLETREKDYQVAMAIGKMLLEKNKELVEQRESVQQQYEQSMKQRDSQIAELLAMVEKYTDKKQELQNELKGLRLQVNALQSGTVDSETKAVLMYEEFSKLEEKNSKHKQQIRQLKSKNKELDDEVEKHKLEIEQLKVTERNLRKQLKNNINTSTGSEKAQSSGTDRGDPDDKESRRKLEDELRSVNAQYQKLHGVLEEITTENLKLREAVEIREQEKEQLNNIVNTLRRANEILQEQEEEGRRLLEDKNHEITMLHSQVEEQFLMMNNSSVEPSNLQKELADLAISSRRRTSSRNLLDDHGRSGSMEMTRSVDLSRSTFDLGTSTQSPKLDDHRPHRYVPPESSQGPDPENLDKELVVAELKALRKQKSEDHAVLSTIYDLRERLADSEIKNITRSMPNVYYFEDILQISNSIIESVIKDTRKKVLDKRGDNDMMRTMAELMFENCKLRKSSNDYAEAINHGTVEKLEKYRKYLVGEMEIDPSSNKRNQASKSWGLRPLFDFFSGWSPNN